MANPTFNTTALTTHIPQEMIGGAETRLYMEAMPGLKGRYVQGHGTGARTIMLRGILRTTATHNTAAVAVGQIKADFRTKSALADGSTVADYVGADGDTYESCVLMSYEQAGRWLVSSEKTTPEGAVAYRGYVAIAAVIVQLDTTTP